MIKKLLFAVLTISTCVSGYPDLSKAEEPISIALSAPLTGRYQEYGKNFQKAIELGIDTLNEAGGIHGRPIELVLGDSKGEPKRSKSLARSFVKNSEIVAVLGDFTSSCSMAAQPIYHRAQLVQLSPSSSHPSFAPGSPYSFGIVGTQAEDGPAMARQAVQTLHKKNIAMLHINSEWGNVTRQLFSEEVERQGGKMVAVESYLEGTTDFSAQLESVRKANPDLLFLCSTYQDGSLIVKQRHELGWDDVTLMASSALYSSKLLEEYGDASEGLYTFTAFFPKDPRPEVQAFVKEFSLRYDNQPNMFAALAYDAVHILVDAIKRGGTERQAIRDELAATQGYMGLTGDISFSQNGDILKSFLLLQVKNGEFVLASE